MQNNLKQGEALFAEGKIEEAEKCFLEILNENPKNKEVYNNLGVIAFQQQNIELAVQHLTRSLEIDPFYKDSVLNYCDVLRSLNLIHKVLPFLEKVIQKYPDDRELFELLHEVRSEQRPRTKIAVLCLPGLQSFLGDIVDYLKTKYDVRTCYSTNNQEIESAVKWADIVWLEWANEIATFVTNHLPLTSKKHVVCRIHSYEVLSGYLPKINWSKVSLILYVADHIRRIAHEVHVPLANHPSGLVIKNGIALDRFKFNIREPGFNLAVVGSINHKKNPPMWIEILSRLVKIDSRYRLKVAGELQDPRYGYYFQNIIARLGLKDHIQFFGYIKDIPQWFEREEINYLLSTSIFESFGYNIAEAMAIGIRPLIHSFPGAEELWPHDCLFFTSDELIAMIRKDKDYNSRLYREFVEQRYPLQIQLENLDKILTTHDENVFDCSKYWNERLEKNFSITGVGHIGLSAELNQALYADRLYLLDCLIGNGALQGKSVLEIGPGIGQFTDYFFGHKNLNDYLGVDIAKISVNELTKKFGKRFKFTKGDFASSEIMNSVGEEKFDIVFAAAVLLHIMSNNGYCQFIANIGRALKNGGIYIGMEPISFLSKEETDNINKSLSAHNRLFRWEELHRCFEKNGLIVESLTPLFSIMNTPLDTSKINEIRANALNSLVVESAKNANENQDLINTIRFIDKNLIEEYRTGLSEWAVVCRKGEIAENKRLPKSVSYKSLLKQLSSSVETRDKIPDVNNLLKNFETIGYDAGRLIENFIPYHKKHVEKFISFEPIEPLTIKAEEIGNGTFHIDMLLRNSNGGQLVVQNLRYVPQHTLHGNLAFDPMKSYLFNVVSKLKLAIVQKDSIKTYVFNEKLKKDIQDNELVYTWERAYPGTQFMHFRSLATIARRYAFAQRYIEGKDILEAASGFGYGAASFSNQARSIMALDIAEENVEFGKRTYGFENISWRQGDVIELPYKNLSFDTYVSFETIEHLKYKTIPVYLSEASRVLRTDGIFIISTPNLKTREGRIDNPYRISEMYYEQLKEYLEKTFDEVNYYSTKGLSIYWGAYPSWADGFIAVCEKR